MNGLMNGPEGLPRVSGNHSYANGLNCSKANGILGNSVFESEEEALAGQIQAWNLTFAFASSMALKAACTLGIPDILAREGHEGSLSLQEISSKLASKAPDTNYLFRILRFLTFKGFFSVKSVLTSSGAFETKYGLTPISKWFVKSNELCMAPMAIMQTDKITQAPWHHFSDCLLEGGFAFEKANGVDIWAFANQDPEFNSLFNNAMACNSEIVMNTLLKNYDGFKNVRTLIDVGGGIGAALSRIIEAYPSIEGINFDLPHVVSTAPSYPGVTHVGGDMFERIPSADAVFMKWIMHDWDDTCCIKILQNCRKALPDTGKVIIVDIVLDIEEEWSSFRETRLVFDLVMIAHAIGGRERTEKQWRDLIKAAGFASHKILTIPNLQCVIEAYVS